MYIESKESVGEPTSRKVKVSVCGTAAEFETYKSSTKDYTVAGGSTFVVTYPFAVYMYDEASSSWKAI